MTHFGYACFVSYRNSREEDGLISAFARELANALEKYLDGYLYEDISQSQNPDESWERVITDIRNKLIQYNGTRKSKNSIVA